LQISIPIGSLNFLETTRKVQPLSGRKKGVVIGRDPGRPGVKPAKPPQYLLNLLSAQPLSSEFGQDAVVSDDVCWALSSIPRSETCNAPLKPRQEKTGADAVRACKDLTVISLPIHLFPCPLRFGLNKFAVAGAEQCGD